MSIILFVIILIAFPYIWWQFYFLRNPNRNIPGGDGVVSPADGKVIAVFSSQKKDLQLFKNNKKYRGQIKTMTTDVADEVNVIVIYMSLFDVHYNRIPVAGKILKVTHSPGKLLPATLLRASFLNEKVETVITYKKTQLKVIQVAGLIARRIETFVKPGDTLAKGAVYGRINLGSQVIVVLPKSSTVNIKVNDRVRAGETLIANQVL